jgi:hypothetical protein
MAATTRTAALASGRRFIKRFIGVSQPRRSDVEVRVQPHGSDRKDRIGQIC